VSPKKASHERPSADGAASANRLGFRPAGKHRTTPWVRSRSILSLYISASAALFLRAISDLFFGDLRTGLRAQGRERAPPAQVIPAISIDSGRIPAPEPTQRLGFAELAAGRSGGAGDDRAVVWRGPAAASGWPRTPPSSRSARRRSGVLASPAPAGRQKPWCRKRVGTAVARKQPDQYTIVFGRKARKKTPAEISRAYPVLAADRPLQPSGDRQWRILSSRRREYDDLIRTLRQSSGTTQRACRPQEFQPRLTRMFTSKAERVFPSKLFRFNRVYGARGVSCA